MAWYYGTYSCGHEGRTNITGPTKNREWIKERHFEGLCGDCYKAKKDEERAIENQKAVEQSAEMELPELSGTEKQVAWANTIRVKILEQIANDIKDFVKDGHNEAAEILQNLIDLMIKNKTKASWYIDMRGYSNEAILTKIKDEYESSTEHNVPEEVIDETLVSPDEVKHAGYVIITGDKDVITATYEKNDSFRDVVKSLGYKWGSAWERELDESTGSFSDRAAELGNALLHEGFVISIQDEDIREKAINANFEPECKKWIYKKRDESKLLIKWNGRNDNLYKKARKIKGSKWDSPYVVVDVSHYESIEKFAEAEGFKFARSAIREITAYREKLGNAVKVTPDSKKI